MAVLLWSGVLFAQATGPSIRLSAPSQQQSQTDRSSITLTGTAGSAGGLGNVLWVNQFGQRGSGTWIGGAQTVTWTLANVPLRVGVNSLAVTVVDRSNRSATLHLAIDRTADPASLPAALPVGTGSYQNRPIVYQIWNGLKVVEGDIVLDPADASDQAAALHPAAALDSAAAPHPAAVSASAGAKSQSRPVIKPDGFADGYVSQLWPSVGGVYEVPYSITGSSANLTTAINSFNATFAGLIKFVLRSTQANYANIQVMTGGGGEGMSNVGMVGGAQILTCGSDCTVTTWLHEMGHTVGLFHEHQRPDRANFITFNPANGDLPNEPGNFTPISFANQTIGLYDIASVMHYCAFCFSKAGLPVLESIPAGIPMSNDTGYSTGDIDSIKRLYGAAPSQVTITTNPTGLQIVVDGTSYTAPQSFSWPLNSVHTLGLPADPQLTTPADGSTYAFGNWNDLGARTHSITVQGGSGGLTAPANAPAVTVYQASFIRLQPFTYDSPAVLPDAAAGTITPSPAPIAEYGGNFYVDRTLVQLSVAPNAGYQFDTWYDLYYPTGSNPYSFLIQAPTTAQVALAPTGPSGTPVTHIGESLTGPNTWNPGLSATVDGNFTLLPSSFSPEYGNNANWIPGSSHPVLVTQTQSPVTTNVYYNFNSWSDSGSLSHSITQPSTGTTQNIVASYTPFYASYTLPAALGGGNSSCYGGVTTSPAGVTYALNGTFLFYKDGTSVMSTATPNSTYPGMEFAGWSGSLAGSTNPLTTTIHDQFVPTANFNVNSTPLAITALSPSTAAATGTGPLDVAIIGTGLTPTTDSYWNGSQRANTYVSPTQITMHLSAGDLANAGGQEISVSNNITNASNSICGVSAAQSFLVTATAPADGFAEILWHNSSGQAVLWFMNGGNIVSSANLGVISTAWSIAGTGDFNGDGQRDILWRNSNGDVVLWFMNGGNLTSSADLGIVPTAWTVAGTGDFNGDGHTDILWRNSNGQVVIWIMNGPTIASSANLGTIPTSWTVAGTGDFDGNGDADILWHNSNGDTVIWFMNGPTIASSTDLGVVATAWSVADTGDVNGDGKADILWRNVNGDAVIWFMNGGTIASSTDLGVVPTSWTLAVTRDFNGDGKADILWRNSNGDAVVWFMNGGSVETSTDFGVVATSWTTIQ